MMDTEEINCLYEKLKHFFDKNLLGILTRLNRQEGLESFLDLIGAKELSSAQDEFSFNPRGYIVVLGKSDVAERVLLSIANELGIDKSKFKFCIDYEKLKRFDISNMSYNSEYAAVLCGPMPHKTVSSDEYSSTIARLEDGAKEGKYPPTKRLGSNSLHISKSDFKTKLQELINEHIIQIN